MIYLIDTYKGEIAGVATSVLWTATSLLFAEAGRRLGPAMLNGLRIFIAILLLGFTHRLLTGQWVPDAHWRQVAFLAASGIVGLSIGDQALFTAFVDIGPRLSMLIMTTSPLMAAMFGWVALGETLHGLAWIGVALTIAGVAWVVVERPARGPTMDHRFFLRGVSLALIGAACQAGGLLLSKQGIGHGWLPEESHIAPQTATFLRMSFAGIGMIPILIVHTLRERQRRAAGRFPKRIGTPRGGVAFACGGAVVGPFLGVWMSLVASDNTDLGIAQTLCSLTPIFLLPVVYFVHKEHVSPRAITGAVVAVVGSSLLFVRPG